MSHKIRIFRLSLAGDSETTLDSIDFNDPTVPNHKHTDIENAFITKITIPNTHSIADQQGAEQEESDKESLGPVEGVYIIDGFISKTDGDLSDGMNQFLLHLDLWDAEPDFIDGVWDEGRFGIIDDNDHTNDFVPVRTGSARQGLLWDSYVKESDLGANRTIFRIKLRVNKGDGT